MKRYTAKDIAAMYDVSLKTARRYMHQMGCETKPLRVSEAKLNAWIKLREPPCVDYRRAMKKYASEYAAKVMLERMLRAK